MYSGMAVGVCPDCPTAEKEMLDMGHTRASRSTVEAAKLSSHCMSATLSGDDAAPNPLAEVDVRCGQGRVLLSTPGWPADWERSAYLTWRKNSACRRPAMLYGRE